MDTLKKCGRCYKAKPFTEYKQKRTGDYNKTCIQCIEEKAQACKCEHGINKSQCVTCEGGSMCIHKKRRTYCPICGGGGLCPHLKKKTLVIVNITV